MGVGNADQSWYGVSKRRMDRKSQSLGPRLKFQLSHVLLQSNVGAQVLLSQALVVSSHNWWPCLWLGYLKGGLPLVVWSMVWCRAYGLLTRKGIHDH